MRFSKPPAMTSIRPIVLIVAGAVAIGSCTDSTEPLQATTITFAPAVLAFAAIGEDSQVVATVFDQKGNVMAAATPTWASNLPGIASVNGAGLVIATGSGSASISATVGTAVGTLPTTVNQVATAFEYGSGSNGNGTSAVRGTAVSVRPAVQILDANGNGIPGQTVTFTVLTGGGSVGAAAAVTDGTGIARVTSWTLGATAGENTLRATYATFTPVVFTVTATEDPCLPAGAPTIAVGDVKNGSIATSDCLAGDGKRFDLFKLVLASPTGVVIDMVASHDAYLMLFASDNATLVAEDDDGAPSLGTDSRIGVALAAGTYYLRATSFEPGQTGSYQVSIVPAAGGVPATVTIVQGNGQVIGPGNAVPVPPSVLVTDAVGSPVPNVPVTFAIVPGVGSITGASAVTDVNGRATLGSWTVAAGANVLAASVPGSGVAGNPAMFGASGNASTSGYNVSLRFIALPTVAELQAFSAAAQRWEAIITSDPPPVTLNFPANTCLDESGLNETVDDLVIFVVLEAMDGPNGTLGSAGPCIFRIPETGQPVVGVMRFDTADIPDRIANGSFTSIVLHEMGHVIGIGTRWGGFLFNPSLPSSPGADTHFNGANAIAGFNAIGGATWTGSPGVNSKVPVENSQGGAGSRDSHWRESVLQNELMTGFLNTGAGILNPLSLLSIRSLQDLGYTVNTGQADAFSLSLSLRAAGSAEGPLLEMKNDILHLPQYYVDATGRPVGIRRWK